MAGPTRRNRRLAAALLLVCTAVCRAENEAPANASLRADSPLLRDGSIGSIEILNANIFDLDDPDENKALYRLANRIHSKTDAEIIARQLLFTSGERFDASKLAESERLLRSTRYLGDVTIRPVRLRKNVVDIEVHTRDDWTLKPSLSFGRKGGENSSGIGIEEYNLFGRGVHVGAEFKSGVDRDSFLLRYSDRNLFGRRYALSVDYADNSDGFDRRFELEKPFYSLRTLHAGGLSLRNGRQLTTLYDRGKAIGRFDHSFIEQTAYVGWSQGLEQGRTRRLVAGVHIDAHRFRRFESPLATGVTLPESYRYIYPYIGIELMEDEFEKTRNVDQIGRVEDRHLGAALSMKLGYSSRAWGASGEALHLEAGYSNAWQAGKHAIVRVSSSFEGRYGKHAAANLLFSFGGRFDLRQSDKRLLHARIRANAGRHLDPQQTLYLGGGSGLRGYPLRYLNGERNVLLTVEQRLFTDWYPLRIFRLGGAVFVDAGRSWGGPQVSGPNPGWLTDIGVGLRLGNTRSSVGRVLHIDLAMPLNGAAELNGLQLQIEAKRSF